MGTRRVDWSKHGAIFATCHKNLGTVGATLVCVRKDLINEETIMPFTPAVVSWNSFYKSPNKVYNVPTIFSIWMFSLTC